MNRTAEDREFTAREIITTYLKELADGNIIYKDEKINKLLYREDGSIDLDALSKCEEKVGDLNENVPVDGTVKNRETFHVSGKCGSIRAQVFLGIKIYSNGKEYIGYKINFPRDYKIFIFRGRPNGRLDS